MPLKKETDTKMVCLFDDICGSFNTETSSLTIGFIKKKHRISISF